MQRWPSDDPDGLLFQASLGGRIRRDHWQPSGVELAVIEAGRPDLTFHALRHFYASAFIRLANRPLRWLGDSGNTPQMVLQVYSHLWKDDAPDLGSPLTTFCRSPPDFVVHGLWTAWVHRHC